MKEQKQQLKEMSSFFKQLLNQDSWIKELHSVTNTEEKNENKKIKNIHLIDNKLLASFWKKYSIYNIEIYDLWKAFKNISLNNMQQVNNKNILQTFLSTELSIFLIRLIKTENKINFNQTYDFLDYEYIQIQDIFNSLVNILDKLNLIPIQINLTKENKEQAIKISKKQNWTEFDAEDIQFLKKVKTDYFKNRFYKKYFNKNIDKINFYEHYLADARNQITHYPIINHSLKNNEEFKIILFNLQNNTNNKIPFKTSLLFLSFKRGIVLATLYLFLVY
ncbi:hypothetical protein [Spiroplasma endosymbiont of Andrena trimmerana]|uniref:hypothetical protein n=1 Tax=Spiroplasma endosymbiont of Andrena trimmerana TaxID=3066316 RepID=UPI0030CB2BD9